ncbi:MAG: class I SAM-dependent methyltransferase, partial [Chloroflexi bacterium]|nr:class I SAM-dependent methyltransferase [Chloroflexota bacterium]
PTVPDALRPSAAACLQDWAARVLAERAQTDRCREVADPADFYAPTAHRFRFEPAAPLDAVGQLLESMARPRDIWLDVGAGGGRYSLAIARLTRRVIAVDPSRSMLDTLHAGVADSALDNVTAIEGRWPPAGWTTDPAVLAPFRADVALIAHVGYDIEDIGPFLDALEAVAARRCVAVMGEGAMTTVGRLYWAPIHGEPRVALPALPELLTLLIARGRLPEVRLVDREPPVYASFEALHDRARRQSWVRPGSARDGELERLLRSDAVDTDGAWGLPEDTARIGVVSWSALD